MKMRALEFDVYTDGGARGNGKTSSVGGWGIYLEFGNETRSISGGELGVTNNQMELMACIRALEIIASNQFTINIYTDSAYVCNCINQKWYAKWRKNGWKSGKNPVKNKDLWERLLKAYESKTCEVNFIKVKGHSGVYGNEMADALCNEAMDELEEKAS